MPFAKTVTFQTSYLIRSCKEWNVLSNELRRNNISFYAFKCGLKFLFLKSFVNDLIAKNLAGGKLLASSAEKPCLLITF